jgi:hypothetical protein
MAKFSELGIGSDVIIGKCIDIEDLFDRHILIEKTIIQPTKFPGKNQSGLRMQMQVVLATFLENGSYVKHADGTPDGERRSCFTGSDILINSIQKAEANIQSINTERKEKGLESLQLYPLDTTIVKVGKCFQFK